MPHSMLFEPITELPGPVIDKKCKHICKQCAFPLSTRTIPLLSIANGNWLGDVPTELRGLSYTERLLIAKVRKNWFIVRVESGLHKMRASVVLFPTPVIKIYKALLPHRDGIDTVLAVIFCGPGKPTPEDLCQTTLLHWRHAKIFQDIKVTEYVDTMPHFVINF